MLSQLIKAAESAMPNEACGLLAGQGSEITKFYEMTNADASPEHFTMLPKEQFAAVKDMRTNGTEILAIWHSHPETPPRMSEEDIKLAYAPGAVHIILSLAESNKHEAKGYQVNNGISEAIDIIIED
jgi:proteasome lid subunit RPN8/RPN11